MQPNQTQPTAAVEIVESLIQEFTKSVMQWPTESCLVCRKLIYPSLRCRIVIGPQIKSEFSRFGTEFQLNQVLTTCSRCYTNLRKGKLPAQAECNNMFLAPIPQCILSLNIHEVELIRRVRCYMKIKLLNNGKGQKALHGTAIHFPQDIDDLAQQLPLEKASYDTIYVTEKNENDDFIRKITVRPRYLLDALTFLKQNNPLYEDILLPSAIDAESLKPKVITNDCPEHDREAVMDISRQEITAFRHLRNGISLLRGTINQSCEIFGSIGGNQCTAMCASFGVHAVIESPLHWTSDTVDAVLMDGNSYYRQVRPNARDNFLQIEEIAGEFSCYQLLMDIRPATVHSYQRLYEGDLNRANTHSPRLDYQLGRFINSGERFGIITCNSYSMGIFVEQDYVFLFDSHSRGPAGWCSENGTACVIKYPTMVAPTEMSTLIHRNVQPRNREAPIHQFRFSITSVSITRVTEPEEADDSSGSSDDDDVDTVSSYQVSPMRKKNRFAPTNIFNQQEDKQENDNNDEIRDEVRGPLIARDFAGQTDGDCVIADDAYIEPYYENYDPNQLMLTRKQKHPISPHVETNLELLAFPQIFSYGTNGLNQERLIKQTPLDYFQARIMGSDPRFNSVEYLFYALDVCDRYRAYQKINVCANMRIQGNEEQVDDDRMVDPKLFMGSIRGTQQYWENYKGNLIAMVKTLGTPTFFATFSYDDMNSNDAINALWKAKMGPDAATIDPESLSYQEKKELLNNYPVAAARHFSMRLTKFLSFCKNHSVNIFGKPLQDFSVRVEFQLRGSPHIHMVIWLENAPDFNTDEGIEFINRNVSCSLDTPFKDLVLKYQKHRHTDTCHKNGKANCRFHFPQSPSHETVVLGDEEIHRNGGKFVKLRRTEEEVMINPYHPILLPIMKVNMDIQPCTSSMAIAYYIAKYISKSEPKELQTKVQDAIKEIKNCEHLTARQKMQNICRKIMNRRQVSAQEAAFRLCHLYLLKSSRATVFVPVFRPEKRFRMLRKETLEADEQQFCLNIIDRYFDRPRDMEQICLFEFACHYEAVRKPKETVIGELNDEDVDEHGEDVQPQDGRNSFPLLHNKGRIRQRQKPCVVKFPNFNPIQDRENYYYSLMLLYYPTRDENFMEGYDSCEEAFRALYNQFRKHEDDPCINPGLALEVDQALLRVMDLTPEEREQANIEEELEFDFVENGDVPVTHGEVFPAPSVGILEDTRRRIGALNSDQKIVFNRFENVLKVMVRSDEDVEQLKLIVNGEGGTGKSFVIRLCSDYARNAISHDSILLCAPTGKASFQIGGMTLHRTFSLPVEIGGVGKLLRLGSRKLDEFRKLYKNVKFIIIDEMSMISYETLRNIHIRLTEIFNNEDDFGGRHIILLGDLLQIKCVRGSYIFKKPKRYEAELDLWRMFDFLELRMNERQTSGDPLLGICRRLRVGEMTEEDVNILMSRVLRTSDPGCQEMYSEFQDCLWAFPTIRQADVYNQRKLKQMEVKGKRLYKINAIDRYGDGIRYGQNCPSSLVHAKESKTAGIPSHLILTEDSRIMLRRNLDVISGKVNGALGTVVGFEWNLDNRQVRDGEMPRYITVHFDHEPSGKLEKIYPCNVDFIGKRNVRIMRQQLPVISCFATNYHKLQGETLSKVCIDLGKKVFGKGMAYVALSRVKTLTGLAISELDVNKLISTGKYKPCDTVALEELRRLREVRNDNYPDSILLQ